jgi:hypothetical protein
MRVQPLLLTRPILTLGLPVGSNSAPTKPLGTSVEEPKLADTVEISAEAAAVLSATELVSAKRADDALPPVLSGQDEDATETVEEASDKTDDSPQVREEDAADRGQTANGELTPEEEEQVQKLSERDKEVRAHEQAHLSAAGPHARGGPTYEYQRGPDGQRYAVGGEVQIDVSPVDGDPEATIAKMQVVRAAALAPAEPSAQDRKVAATATKTEAAARAELSKQQIEENEGQPDSGQLAEAVRAYLGNVSSSLNLVA